MNPFERLGYALGRSVGLLVKTVWRSLFGKSVASRYEEAGAALGPSGVAELADPVTWAALLLARDEIRRAYLPAMSALINTDDAKQIWENEIFRLLNDGYLLGRIEAKSEGRTLSFSGIADADPAYEAGEFAAVAAQAISIAVTSDGTFSEPPSSEVDKLLKRFASDAGRLLLESLDLTAGNQAEEETLLAQSRLSGEANIRTVQVGREIALREDFYVNPEKRRDLLRVRERIQAEGHLEFEKIRLELKFGLETPSDWAAQMMRKVYDEIAR